MEKAMRFYFLSFFSKVSMYIMEKTMRLYRTSCPIFLKVRTTFSAPGLKRYKILSLVGDGTYGLVYLALNTETREKVGQRTVVPKEGD